MKQLKGWASAAAAGVVCIAVGFAACGKSSSSSGLGSNGGGGGATGTKAAAVSQLLGLTGTYGVVPVNGVLRPRFTIPSTQINCPTSGSMTIGGNLNTSGSNPINLSGNISDAFNSCVVSGYTFGGTWNENFNLTYSFNSSYTSFTISGTITVPSGTTITVNSSSCSVDETVTYNNLTYNQSSGLSGSVSYNGTACGTSGSGTCTFSGYSATCN